MDHSNDEAVILCRSCGRRQVGSPHLCGYCGAPLTPHASTDPMLGILARGFAAYQATTKPRKLIVVLGIWLWIGPMMLMGLLFSSMALSAELHGISERKWFEAALELVILAVPVGLVVISAAILIRTTEAYFRGRPDFGPNAGFGAEEMEDVETNEPTKCLACGKTMADDSNQCAACGWSFSEFN